jgi:hypothetical protein
MWTMGYGRCPLRGPLWRPSARTLFHGFGAPRACRYRKEEVMASDTRTSLGEYVRDNVTTNGVESVFAVLKRGIFGTFHHVSAKHLNRYVGEFAFRLNDGDVSRHTLDRLSSLFGAAIGRRLTYAELIA